MPTESESKRQLLVMLLRESAHQYAAAPAPEQPSLSLREIDDLAKLARQEIRSKKQKPRSREAQLIADMERALATQFSATDAQWRDLVSEARQMIADVNQRVAQMIYERGFPKSFAPTIDTCWSSRGESALAGRRAELRRAMQARYEAERQAAETEVEEELVNYLKLLTRAGLTSARAIELLEQMKPLEELLKPIDFKQLQKETFRGYLALPVMTAETTDDNLENMPHD